MLILCPWLVLTVTAPGVDQIYIYIYILFEIFWNILRYVEIFWAILRYFEICWDMLKYFEKCWDMICLDMLRYFEIFWDMLRYCWDMWREWVRMILSLSDIVWEEMGIRIVGNISINTIPQNTSLYGDVKRVFVEDFDLAYPINHFWM